MDRDAARLPAIVGNAPSLRVSKSAVEGVVIIRDPMLSATAMVAEREKTELIERLTARYSGCAAWLDDRHEALTRGVRPLSDRITGLSEGDWCGWFAADVALLRELVRSPEGGWACVFFDRDIPEPLTPVTPLPIDPEGIQRLRRDMGAQVAIASELDDEYWVLCVEDTEP